MSLNISGSGALQGQSLSVAAAASAGSVLSSTTVQATTELSGATIAVGGGNFTVSHAGELNAGSITSGFGSINNGSSNITTTGLISGGSLDIDDVVINGTNIGHTDDTDLLALSDSQLQVNGKLIVMADLDIRGNTTTISTTNTEFNDTLIGLGFASGSNDRAVGDRGLIFGLDSEDDAAVFWDESESQFAFVKTDSGLDATPAIVTGKQNQDQSMYR